MVPAMCLSSSAVPAQITDTRESISCVAIQCKFEHLQPGGELAICSVLGWHNYYYTKFHEAASWNADDAYGMVAPRNNWLFQVLQ